MKEHSETRRDYHFEDVGIFCGQFYMRNGIYASQWLVWKIRFDILRG